MDALQTPMTTPINKLQRTPFQSLRSTHLRTPLSRRLNITREILPNGVQEETHAYEGLIRKTWTCYSLSPLYNFIYSKPAFHKYERSLDLVLSQGLFSGENTEDRECLKSSFEVYQGLNCVNNDPEAVQIIVTSKLMSGTTKVVLNAFLICVSLQGGPLTHSYFTYFPVMLVKGIKSKLDSLLRWLEQHFDCSTAPIRFSDNDLRWMLATWTCQNSPKESSQVLIQYSTSDVCDGINSIDCKFESSFGKHLWQCLIGDVSARVELNEIEVKLFVDALEHHLDKIMNIYFSKMTLSEVGSSVAYVSYDGKLKIFSSSDVLSVLHLVCEIIKDKYMVTTLNRI